jgi:hypothetical protein
MASFANIQIRLDIQFGLDIADTAARRGSLSETAGTAAPCSNTARQASLRLVFCRRRQNVSARTLGISPAQGR